MPKYVSRSGTSRVSSNHQKKSVTKFVTDFGEIFFFKEVSAKAQTQFGGGRLGQTYLKKKSLTKVSDKFFH